MALNYVDTNYWYLGYAEGDEIVLIALPASGSAISTSGNIQQTIAIIATSTSQVSGVFVGNITVKKILTVTTNNTINTSTSSIIGHKHILLSNNVVAISTATIGTILVTKILSGTSTIGTAISNSIILPFVQVLIAESVTQLNTSSVEAIEYWNLRVVPINVAKTATLTTSNSLLTGFSVYNIVDNNKGKVFRHLNNYSNILMSWVNNQAISCIAMPFSNLTGNATVRIKLYSDSAATIEVFDSGIIVFRDRALYVSKYTNIKSISIYVEDLSLTYIDISAIVCGSDWSPKYNTDFGITVSSVTTDVQNRTHAGNILTDIGSTNKLMNIPLNWMTETDKQIFFKLLRANDYMFISVFPNDKSFNKRTLYQIYGKATSLSSISYNTYGMYSSSISIEEL